MDNELKGTQISSGKGDSALSEVEELIRQTLEESKVSAPAESKEKAAVKEDFKATTYSASPPKPVAPAAPTSPVMQPTPAKPAVPANSYDATFNEYKAGDIVKGKVVKVDQTGVLVDIKYKSDGLILPGELSLHPYTSVDEVVKVGEIIEVFIEKLESKEGYVILSKARADHERHWKIAMNAFRNKTLLEGKVLQALKGGLVVDCDGLRGFVPASQVNKRPEETFESFVGQNIPLKIIEVNRHQGKIILSHRLAAGDKEKEDHNKLINELEVGQIRKGKVVSLKNFGAFVDLGGIEGLVHLSELSWKRVKHPSEVVKLGDEVEVFVLGVDKANKKVALGMRQLQPDPWASATEHFKSGQIIKVKILRFAKFGAFVELGHGLEGLIHISELSKEPVATPEEAKHPDGTTIKLGDVVDAKILRVIPDEQRIGLSVKQVQVERERQALKEVQQTSAVEEKKVTIGDMIAEKERAKAERDGLLEEAAEGSSEEIPT
ncbi:MAG: S1 RNA-binding domain-containing protein [Candidatus Margulisbacteria bacterium]|nr:S1 RNA-binding domain-containing protein [Candidatus Margulisiibacteriota bacterium]MBU1617216.1 S1 RNA-binding domain-containing protein [Candidatus Margulisiibacteriota bacterium]